MRGILDSHASRHEAGCGSRKCHLAERRKDNESRCEKGDLPDLGEIQNPDEEDVVNERGSIDDYLLDANVSRAPRNIEGSCRLCQ